MYRTCRDPIECLPNVPSPVCWERILLREASDGRSDVENVSDKSREKPTHSIEKVATVSSVSVSGMSLTGINKEKHGDCATILLGSFSCHHSLGMILFGPKLVEHVPDECHGRVHNDESFVVQSAKCSSY